MCCSLQSQCRPSREDKRRNDFCYVLPTCRCACCIFNRAIGFLAARVSGRQRRRSSAPAAGAGAAELTSAASSGSTHDSSNQDLVGNATKGSKSIGDDGQKISDIRNLTNHSTEDDTNNTGDSDHNSTHIVSGTAHLDPSSHSFERDSQLGVAGIPSPSSLRTAGVRTAQTPRPSRRRRLPAGPGGDHGGDSTGSGGGAAVAGVRDRSAAVATAEHVIVAAVAARGGSSSLPSERTGRPAWSAAGPERPGKLGAPRTGSATAGGQSDERERQRSDNADVRHGERRSPRGSAEWEKPERLVGRRGTPQRGDRSAAAAAGGGGRATVEGTALLPPPPATPTERSGDGAAGNHRNASSCSSSSVSFLSSAATEVKAGAGKASSFRRTAPRSKGTPPRLRPSSSRENQLSLISGGGGGGGGKFDFDYSCVSRDALGLEMSVAGEISSGVGGGGASGSRRRERKRYACERF